MQIINASIDLTKIDKSQIKEHANGAKYYPISIIINDQKDNFGNDVAITNSQSKEARAAGEKKVYIGNGKIVFTKNSEATPPAPTQVASASSGDLPF